MAREQLTTIDAAVVLVAHDRWFLEAVGTAVLELEGGRSRFFSGPWHAWRKERAARELALGRAIERQQAEIERLERFVTRFRAGTRARQAQSRAEEARQDQADQGRSARDGKALGFSFDAPSRTGRIVLEVEGGVLKAGDRELMEGFEMWLERGEHVSLVGPNGAGKTTLIETLAGLRELDKGKLRRGHNVEIGFLSQHAEELGHAGQRARGGAARHRSDARTRRARCSAGSCSRARRRRSRWPGCRAASGGGSRLPCSYTRRRTC